MSQQSLTSYAKGLIARPGSYDVVQTVRDAVTGIADDLGVSLDRFGARPGELDDSIAVLRYQYSTTYEFYMRDRKDDDTEIGQVQFRTTLYTTSDPSDRVKDYIKDINHKRLHALFETGDYDGYMSGFGFISSEKNEEVANVVGQDQVPATGLGVPNFSCEVYDDSGDILGYSKGYSMDFGVHETEVRTDDAPQQEEWTVRSFNSARGDYEIGPSANSPARERAKNASGKTVYVNGLPVGSVTSRGTVWLTKEHQRPGAATYKSRKYITENTGTPYQALSPGSKLSKVQETPEGLYFSTVAPKLFDPTPSDAVDPDDTGIIDTEKVMDLDEDQATTFIVTQDEADPWALGKRTPTATITIDTGINFFIQTG